MPVLEVSGVAYTFPDETPGLDAVDLSVEAGELVAVVGPSGSGKTTLLRVIAGLVKPDSGTVCLSGRDVTAVPSSERRIAMVFQDRVMYPMRTVREMISFPLEMRRTPRNEIDHRVDSEARVLGIRQLLEWDPAVLSAGHQQAVQTAKALVGRPDLYLFDEPLARLDTSHRALVRREFRTLQRGYGIAALWVTNDREEALAIADTIVVLVDGSVVAGGPPRRLHAAPDSMFIADFIAGMDLLEASVVGDRLRIGDGEVRTWWPGIGDYARVVVGVRPDSVGVGRRDHGIPARVDHLEFLGDRFLVHLDLGGRLLRAYTDEPADGEVGVVIDPRAIHLFDPATGEAVMHPLSAGDDRA